MTLSRRNKIILLITAAVIAIILILVLIWWLGGRGPATPSTNTNQPFEPERLPVDVSVNARPSPVKEPALEASFKAIASSFAERYGSYSNESNFENLDDLRSLMTVKMRGTVDSFIANQRTDAAAGAYYGITTKALVTTVTAFDESLGRAEVTLNTQRQESKGSTANPRVFYQTIIVNLVNTADGWKVDEALWQ